MKPFRIALVTLSLLSNLAPAGELAGIAKRFVSAVTENNTEDLSLVYADSPTKQGAMDAMTAAAPMFLSGKMKVSTVDKELIIGDLGATLIRIEATDPPKAEYNPMICIKIDDAWKVYPWAMHKDLDSLLQQLTPEEKIHLKLLNNWVDLTNEQLRKEEAEQGGDGDAE